MLLSQGHALIRSRRNFSQVKLLGVVGSGQMGSGIAKVALTSKFPVIMMDSNEKSLMKGKTLIEKLLAGDVTKQRLTQDEADAAINRLQVTTDLKSLAPADFVVEAATENFAIKFQIFESLDGICPPSTILASNTSSISISSIAAHTKRPHNVIGMHFMNPVPVMKLVEIIPGLATCEATKIQTLAFAKALGKETTESRDIAGFIANRLLAPYLNEAIYALYEGIGTKEDIDTTMKLGTNVPMGPLTLADFIGLDTLLSILKVLQNELGDRYKPCPLLARYVELGWLGKKSGRGFYDYTSK